MQRQSDALWLLVAPACPASVLSSESCPPSPVAGCHIDMDSIFPRDAQQVSPQNSPPTVHAS